jgi:hypothetical protein
MLRAIGVGSGEGGTNIVRPAEGGYDGSFPIGLVPSTEIPWVTWKSIMPSVNTAVIPSFPPSISRHECTCTPQHHHQLCYLVCKSTTHVGAHAIPHTPSCHPISSPSGSPPPCSNPCPPMQVLGPHDHDMPISPAGVRMKPHQTADADNLPHTSPVTHTDLSCLTRTMSTLQSLAGPAPPGSNSLPRHSMLQVARQGPGKQARHEHAPALPLDRRCPRPASRTPALGLASHTAGS